MRYGVVRAFVYVLPVERLGDDFVEETVHVGPDVRVGVLVQGDGAAGVLDEQVQHSDLFVIVIVGKGVRDVRGFASASGKKKKVEKAAWDGRTKFCFGLLFSTKLTLVFLRLSPSAASTSFVIRWHLLSIATGGGVGRGPGRMISSLVKIGILFRLLEGEGRTPSVGIADG